MSTSPTIHNSWATFLQQSICPNPGPTCYQHVTQNIFINLINRTYSTTTHPTLTTSTESLTKIEENALQYVTGYICQTIISQLMKSKHEHKQILLFMSDTSGFEMDLDKETETWTNFFGSRGNIYHVSDKTHNLFYHMELELCKYFNLRASVMEANSKPFIIKKISDNNKVLHQWHTLTED